MGAGGGTRRRRRLTAEERSARRPGARAGIDGPASRKPPAGSARSEAGSHAKAEAPGLKEGIDVQVACSHRVDDCRCGAGGLAVVLGNPFVDADIEPVARRIRVRADDPPEFTCAFLAKRHDYFVWSLGCERRTGLATTIRNHTESAGPLRRAIDRAFGLPLWGSTPLSTT